MKLIDALKLHDKRRIEIPDCSRNDLPGFFKEMGFKVGVEVGVYKGDYTVELCKAGLKVYGVDPWLRYDEYNVQQSRQDEIYEIAKKNVSPYDCTLIRKTSMKASTYFSDRSIDFVYIDGHHGFKYVAEDLWEWSKKVKIGGIISGHDYALNGKEARDPFVAHVKYAIEGFVQAFNISPWYVLGRGDRREGERRDRWRSWMFLNP